jgi:hypothetical protein
MDVVEAEKGKEKQGRTTVCPLIDRLECLLTYSPPRDFREMTFNGSARTRMGSNNMMSPSNRDSSYPTRMST